MPSVAVTQFRLVLFVEDHERALSFFRDGLGPFDGTHRGDDVNTVGVA